MQIAITLLVAWVVAVAVLLRALTKRKVGTDLVAATLFVGILAPFFVWVGFLIRDNGNAIRFQETTYLSQAIAQTGQDKSSVHGIVRASYGERGQMMLINHQWLFERSNSNRPWQLLGEITPPVPPQPKPEVKP